jgi:hypothetical protein
MAIYGSNFGALPIPDGVARHFRKELKLPGMARGERARLQGVAQSEAERDAMLVQATNGSRKLHVVTRRTAGAPWFGIYVHFSDGVPDDPLVAGALGRHMGRASARLGREMETGSTGADWPRLTDRTK